MHKMRAHFLFHALPRRPSKGYPEYTEREYALIGRTSTHLSLWIENLDVFRGNDLLALMLNCLCHFLLRHAASEDDSGGLALRSFYPP